jgi:nucleoside-diphosphate-sugar epimerase
MADVVIVGCGDMGRRVALAYLAEGVAVTALVRSPEKGRELEALGIRAVVADLDDPDSLAGFPTAKTILFYFAPPPGGGHLDPRVKNFCEAIPPGTEPSRVVYMSTSGVYGDCGDEIVTEETPAVPQTARGKRRLHAEALFREWGGERNVPVIILRVTGIYGPGRLPVSQLTIGQPVLEEGIANLTNRIHSDDLVQVCRAAALRGETGDIYNVSDGHPSTMTDYFNAAADVLGLPRPRQVSWDEAREVMSPLMISYVGESRRLDNRKMLEKLGITLHYPTLDQGIKVCGQQ